MRTESVGIRVLAIAALLTLPGVLLNCSRRSQPPIDGAAALQPFKQDLMQALNSGLDAGGPTEAMTACNLQAPSIAEANSINGLRVGRSSHRLRNPDNAPSDWVEPYLKIMTENPVARIPVRVVDTGDGVQRYIEPIFIQPMCLPCHGEEISEDVSAKLAELYQDDAAIGFKEGEFRGVFWVEYTQE